MQNENYQASQLPVQYDVRINSLNTSGNRLATASVNINGQFAIRGVKVMSGQNGTFVSMPSYKTADGYHDYCFPCTKEAKVEFDRAVIGAYQQAIVNLQSQGQEMTNGGYSQNNYAPVPQENYADYSNNYNSMNM
jgi:stage V sporulation protein G